MQSLTKRLKPSLPLSAAAAAPAAAPAPLRQLSTAVTDALDELNFAAKILAGPDVKISAIVRAWDAVAEPRPNLRLGAETIGALMDAEVARVRAAAAAKVDEKMNAPRAIHALSNMPGNADPTAKKFNVALFTLYWLGSHKPIRTAVLTELTPTFGAHYAMYTLRPDAALYKGDGSEPITMMYKVVAELAPAASKK